MKNGYGGRWTAFENNTEEALITALRRDSRHPFISPGKWSNALHISVFHQARSMTTLYTRKKPILSFWVLENFRSIGSLMDHWIVTHCGGLCRQSSSLSPSNYVGGNRSGNRCLDCWISNLIVCYKFTPLPGCHFLRLHAPDLYTQYSDASAVVPARIVDSD